MFSLENIKKVLCSLLLVTGTANAETADTRGKPNHEIIFQCAERDMDNFFCTNMEMANPSYVLRLPYLEQKKIGSRVRAFRIMPSLTNLTQKTISFARINLSFWKDDEVSKEFWIEQKIIPGAQSHTSSSYLIRSDVPNQQSFYNKLQSIKEDESYNEIILELIDIHIKK